MVWIRTGSELLYEGALCFLHRFCSAKNYPGFRAEIRTRDILCVRKRDEASPFLCRAPLFYAAPPFLRHAPFTTPRPLFYAAPPFSTPHPFFYATPPFPLRTSFHGYAAPPPLLYTAPPFFYAAPHFRPNELELRKILRLIKKSVPLTCRELEELDWTRPGCPSGRVLPL